MKQQKLTEQRNFYTNPRSMAELGPNFRDGSDDINEWGPSLTKQSEAAACDINNIMEKYTATGFLPDGDGRQPAYGDFSTMETFQEALNIVSSANAQFYSLPAEIRQRFANDPGQFLGFVEAGATDPKVRDELVKMGLAQIPEEKPEKILKDIRDEARKTKSQPDSTASKPS